MEPTLESKKLELHYDNVGEEKARKQALNNVKPDAKNDEIVSFGQLMGQLAPEDEKINSLVLVEKSRFTI